MRKRLRGLHLKSDEVSEGAGDGGILSRHLQLRGGRGGAKEKARELLG